MIDTLTSTPFFGLGVTLLCWYLAVRFQKRTGLLICNPVLVASLLVIGIMLLFHIPLDNYNAGGSIIKLLLAPATAVLALNIYQQRAILKRHFWPVVLSCFVGSLVSILLVQVLCRRQHCREQRRSSGSDCGVGHYHRDRGRYAGSAVCQGVPCHRSGGGGRGHRRVQPCGGHQQGAGDWSSSGRHELHRSMCLRHHHLHSGHVLYRVKQGGTSFQKFRSVFLLSCGTKPLFFPSIQVEWGQPLGLLNRKELFL